MEWRGVEWSGVELIDCLLITFSFSDMNIVAVPVLLDDAYTGPVRNPSMWKLISTCTYELYYITVHLNLHGARQGRLPSAWMRWVFGTILTCQCATQLLLDQE